MSKETEAAEEIQVLRKKVEALTEVATAMRDWIDAVPRETPLPAMPGFDRDWADGVIAGDMAVIDPED